MFLFPHRLGSDEGRLNVFYVQAIGQNEMNLSHSIQES
jgi:hypothetical protein